MVGICKAGIGRDGIGIGGIGRAIDREGIGRAIDRTGIGWQVRHRQWSHMKARALGSESQKFVLLLAYDQYLRYISCLND